MSIIAKTVIVAALGVALGVTVAVLALIIRGRTPTPPVGNLLYLIGAKNQWALEYKKSTNDVPPWNDLSGYIVGAENFRCPQGGTYIPGRVGELPRCSIGGPSHTLPPHTPLE
jgi:hypothetical protein